MNKQSKPKTTKTMISFKSIKQKETLTTIEACAYMGITKRHMYTLTHERRIPRTKPAGKMMYFKRADLDEYMNRNRIATMEELEQRAKGGAARKRQSPIQKQEDETLHDWCMRLTQSLNMTPEQTDALIEVSKQSYIKGSNNARLVLMDDNPTMHY